MTTKTKFLISAAVALALTGCQNTMLDTTASSTASVGDDVIASQRLALATSTAGTGTGPQAPRDLETLAGANPVRFATAPVYTSMNLCNIHFHENAEHRGGEFTTYAGNGDGKGAGTGFRYNGTLSPAEVTPYGRVVGAGKYGDLAPGDTIELHYVHTSAPITPGPTLGSCLSDDVPEPFLRVETQVYVLVNDETAADFVELNRVENIGGLYQAVNIPNDTGTPIQYAGSTTGPTYNEKPSPFKVSWSVRPRIKKVSITSVERWLASNIFEEKDAHGVRNLVVNPELISSIN